MKRLVLFLILMFSLYYCDSSSSSDDTTNNNLKTDTTDVAVQQDTTQPQDTATNDEGSKDTAIQEDTNPYADMTPTPDTQENPDTEETPDTATDTTEIYVPDTGGNDTVQPSGLSCKEFYLDCLPQCPQGPNGQPDQQCAQQCYNQMTPEGATAYQTMSNCLQQNGCYQATSNEEFGKCVEEHCMDEYLGCFHGDKSCADIINCMNACPPNDNQCPGNCLADGSVEGQKQYYAIGDCIQEQCCPDDPSQCTSSNPNYKNCVQSALGQNGACVDVFNACMASGGGMGIINGTPLSLLKNVRFECSEPIFYGF